VYYTFTIVVRINAERYIGPTLLCAILSAIS